VLSTSPTELRSRFGIENDPAKTLPHPTLRERWSSEAEAVGLASLANWGVAADVARDAHAFVVSRGIANMGGPASEQDYADFAAKFKGRLSEDQITTSVEWHRGLGGKA